MLFIANVCFKIFILVLYCFYIVKFLLIVVIFWIQHHDIPATYQEQNMGHRNVESAGKAKTVHESNRLNTDLNTQGISKMPKPAVQPGVVATQQR